MKIWWLFDSDDKGSTKQESAKMIQTLEKQRAENKNTSSIPDDSRGKSTPVNKSIEALNPVPVEEVEILKSIQESNFKGPVNFTFMELLKNVTFFIKVFFDYIY
jgi:hypothetical protein